MRNRISSVYLGSDQFLFRENPSAERRGRGVSRSAPRQQLPRSAHVQLYTQSDIETKKELCFYGLENYGFLAQYRP